MNLFLLEEGARLAYLAGLIVFSAFFSGSETALFSLSREELDDMVHRHPRRGRAPMSRKVATSIAAANPVGNAIKTKQQHGQNGCTK